MAPPPLYTPQQWQEMADAEAARARGPGLFAPNGGSAFPNLAAFTDPRSRGLVHPDAIDSDVTNTVARNMGPRGVPAAAPATTPAAPAQSPMAPQQSRPSADGLITTESTTTSTSKRRQGMSQGQVNAAAGDLESDLEQSSNLEYSAELEKAKAVRERMNTVETKLVEQMDPNSKFYEQAGEKRAAIIAKRDAALKDIQTKEDDWRKRMGEEIDKMPGSGIAPQNTAGGIFQRIVLSLGAGFSQGGGASPEQAMSTINNLLDRDKQIRDAKMALMKDSKDTDLAIWKEINANATSDAEAEATWTNLRLGMASNALLKYADSPVAESEQGSLYRILGDLSKRRAQNKLAILDFRNPVVESQNTTKRENAALAGAATAGKLPKPGEAGWGNLTADQQKRAGEVFEAEKHATSAINQTVDIVGGSDLIDTPWNANDQTSLRHLREQFKVNYRKLIGATGQGKADKSEIDVLADDDGLWDTRASAKATLSKIQQIVQNASDIAASSSTTPLSDQIQARALEKKLGKSGSK